MKTTVYDWELHQGAAVDLLIPVTGLPTTGVGVRCHIRDSVDAVAPRLILAHDNPVNRRVTVSAEGIRIQIGATVTGGLQMAQPRNLWGYDVEVYSLTDADDVLKPRAGTIYAYKEWTREADTVAMPPLASGDGRYLRIDGDQGLTPEQQAWAQYNSNTGPGGPGGASDHGALAGLADDDHPQYHNDARGDARYAPLAHDHDADYEAIGTAAGAVSAHAAAPSAHPISGVDGLAAALALLAPLASPALTGTPTAPTATAGTASTQLATTAFVGAAIAALLNSAPGALDTLDELAAALGDDPNFATTVTSALAGKLAKASNLSDLTDAAAARTNLGAGAVGAAVFQAATAAAIRTLLELGGAAQLNIGSGAGTAAAGDHLHTGVYAAAAHNHALGDITQSGATSGQVPTWNGTAWVPQTPSGASPGGSGSEMQYRSGATFGGAAGTHWDAINGRLSIGAGTNPAGMLHAQASAASVVPLVLQAAASQTAALQEWRDSAGTPVLSVGASSGWSRILSNGSIAVSPGSSGAISAHQPDSTAAGGNARGANAVDWQSTRGSANEVASGARSVIGGGLNNRASGDGAVIVGGGYGIASGYFSSILGGLNAFSSGSYSLSGMYGCTASGIAALALGYQTVASGVSSWALGYQSSTRGLTGAYAWASGQRVSTGDAQMIGQVVRRTTTDATTTTLTTDGAAVSATNVMVLPNNSSLSGLLLVSARDTSGNTASWLIWVNIKRGANAASTAVVYQTTIASDTAALAGVTAAAAADTTQGALVTTVAGLVGTTIDWCVAPFNVQIVR